MRSGLSGALKRRLRRADRRTKVIVQSVVTASADEKATRDEWREADSLTGFDFLDRGVVLDGGNSDLLDRDLDDQVTGLDGVFPETPTYVSTIEWDLSSVDPDFVLASILAELDPDTGGGQVVDQWACQLFSFESDGREVTQVFPVSSRVYADAGAAVARVTFDFTGNPASAVRPGSYPPPGEASVFGRPTTLVAIWGIQSDGTPATNVGWRTSSGTTGTEYTENGHRVRGWQAQHDAATGNVALTVDDLPNIRAVYTTYSSATLTFTTDPLDLGAVPTGTVEFNLLAQEPGGSDLEAQVRNDADTAWVTFQDGDTTDDLTGVGKRQQYDVRFLFTPGTGTSPLLQRVSVRERERTNLDDLATVKEKGSVAIDPITLRGEIMEYDIHVIRDGRRDFRDFITTLLSTEGPSAIELEIYVGHPDLDRSDWLLVDTALVDDHQDDQAGITLNCLSVNRELEQPIPQVKGTGSLTSDPLSYPNTTLKAVWDDVLANQITLASRYVGPGVETTSVNVTNILEDTTARRILDAVAYIDGGGVIGSQGQIQYRSLFGGDVSGIVAIMPKEEVKPLSVTPGARYRTPRVGINYAFDFNNNEYTKQYQAEQDNAVTAFGLSALRKAEVPAEAAKWVTGDDDAERICRRIVESIGEGLILWAAKSTVPYPELEPGDLVAIGVEEFVAKDPNAARAIKGPQLALGVVTAVHDVMGTDFDVWVKDLSDIIPTTTEVTRSTIFGDGDDAGPLGLSDFRLAVQSSTFVRYAWEAGALVDQVRVQDVLVELPASTDAWPTSTEAATTTVLSTDPQQYETAFPDASQARYIAFRPRTAGGVTGPVVRRILNAPRPPVVDVDFSETDAVGTLWLSARGVGISSVEFARKVGRQTQSTFTTADRVGSTGSTAASVVKGGFLGPGEYEHDVELTQALNSFIRSRLTLYNGDVQVYGPFTFDAGNIPAILSAASKDRKVFVTGDTDVNSVLLKRVSGSTWRHHIDGTGGEFDVSVSRSGAAGLGSTESWNMRVVAFRDGKVTASTTSTAPGAFVTKDLTVRGENFAGSTTAFAAGYPIGAPPSTGQAIASITLRATLSSTSFSYKVERRYDSGGGFNSYEDISTSVTPPVGNISTAPSTHDHNTIWIRQDGSGVTVEYNFRCSILNSTGGLVDQAVESVVWEYEQE